MVFGAVNVLTSNERIQNKKYEQKHSLICQWQLNVDFDLEIILIRNKNQNKYLKQNKKKNFFCKKKKQNKNIYFLFL